MEQTMKKYCDANNLGVLKSGQELWERAKTIIPGGNMLLSKRAEMFLPEKWPAYFSKAKGCRVWDLNGHEFIDMSLMGVGTNSLGYGHSEVDDAVREVIDKGNMSTLNCPEEVLLAERLVELHPWAEMVRFARSGGEANAIAVRIARAATGRDKVAVCGYHGWHDWYLSANLADEKRLDGHLLPGLQPNGVPRNLLGTTLTFEHNNIEQLEAIVSQHDLAAIEMEVQRNTVPDPTFLSQVRDIAKRNNIVLIFDECSSGFRQSFGGIHKLYGINPDIAMFGKALGNGYAITAIVGTQEVMQHAQDSFISSTFWTERIGPSAALKTLEVMEKTKSWEYITNLGKKIREKLTCLANEVNVPIVHSGLDAIPSFSVGSKPLEYKTIITQEMLKSNFLASNVIYVSLAHTIDIVDKYISALRPVFKIISECEKGAPTAKYIEGPICHSGFKRLA
jgi:glutamate-1-semialdehyde 2,1-aminomutase